jgi:hypothetical protein
MHLFDINLIFQFVWINEIYVMDEDTKSGVIPKSSGKLMISPFFIRISAILEDHSD